LARRIKQTWNDLAAGGTPVSAGRLNDIENGIFNVDYRAAARVYHNAAQSISNNTVTALAFNSERVDQENNASSTIHDTTPGSNTRLTCRTAGFYIIGGQWEWAAGAINAESWIRLNGTGTGTTTAIDYRQVVGDERRGDITTAYPLAVNDYVELVVRHNAGVAVNVNSSGNYSPEFWMVLVA
jgi:hypothetical protein